MMLEKNLVDMDIFNGKSMPFSKVNIMMRHWKMFSREVMDTLSLEVFKVRSDEALSNLV